MIYDKLVDTDILIWYLKGNKSAYKLIHSIDNFAISVVTYMELVQGMRNKEELKNLKKAIKEWEVKIIYIDTSISAQALFYVEEYFLSHSMQLADALIASTCKAYALTLYTANNKHYRFIKDLDIVVFRP